MAAVSSRGAKNQVRIRGPKPDTTLECTKVSDMKSALQQQVHSARGSSNPEPVYSQFIIDGPAELEMLNGIPDEWGIALMAEQWKPGMQPLLTILQCVSQHNDAKQKLKRQRTVAREILRDIEDVDGFKYFEKEAWDTKHNDGYRFKFLCRDSFHNKDRAPYKPRGSNASNLDLNAGGSGAASPSGRDVKDISRTPTYDCKGSIFIKFSASKKVLDVVYQHMPLHREIDMTSRLSRDGDDGDIMPDVDGTPGPPHAGTPTSYPSAHTGFQAVNSSIGLYRASTQPSTQASSPAPATSNPPDDGPPRKRRRRSAKVLSKALIDAMDGDMSDASSNHTPQPNHQRHPRPTPPSVPSKSRLPPTPSSPPPAPDHPRFQRRDNSLSPTRETADWQFYPDDKDFLRPSIVTCVPGLSHMRHNTRHNAISSDDAGNEGTRKERKKPGPKPKTAKEKEAAKQARAAAAAAAKEAARSKEAEHSPAVPTPPPPSAPETSASTPNNGPHPTVTDPTGGTDLNGDADSAGTDKPARRRTKTGCWTCRNRKLKCDELRPRCTQCARSRPPRGCAYPGEGDADMGEDEDDDDEGEGSEDEVMEEGEGSGNADLDEA